MKTCLVIILSLFTYTVLAENISDKNGTIDAQLFVGEKGDQPLIVGFGGGEGGNAWASNHWKKTRDEFLQKGYAFLAIGYFGMPNTSQKLDRISLNAIYKEIDKAVENPKINANKIALIGGSKGAELILNLASRYPTISAVVAIVPSHVSFPGLTMTMDHSSWIYNNEEIPYVPANERIIPAATRGDLHTMFSIMLEDATLMEVNNAEIPVENINGSILIMSARKDEAWPSLVMSNKIIERLNNKNFPHYYEHIISDGDHASPLEKFPEIFEFLNLHFK
jgi:pimeloyl-ACP methyl ester carboxylesterase